MVAKSRVPSTSRESQLRCLVECWMKIRVLLRANQPPVVCVFAIPTSLVELWWRFSRANTRTRFSGIIKQEEKYAAFDISCFYVQSALHRRTYTNINNEWMDFLTVSTVYGGKLWLWGVKRKLENCRKDLFVTYVSFAHGLCVILAATFS